jgi:putative transcriptional regulator
MKKRNIFAELVDGFDALASARAGKLTLKHYKVEHKPAPTLTGDAIRAVRLKLKLSQPVFARQLRIEPRTVANWEQGVSKPGAQASILIALVDRYPELLDDIAAL